MNFKETVRRDQKLVELPKLIAVIRDGFDEAEYSHSSAQPDRQPTKIPPERRPLTRFVDVIMIVNKYHTQIGT